MSKTAESSPGRPQWRFDLASNPSWATVYPVARRLLPWMIFFVFLAWSWYQIDLFTQLTGGDDNFEFVWVLEWISRSLTRTPADFLHYDLIFHPEGWYIANSAISPGPFLLLLPLQGIGGTAFAMNVSYLLMLAITYAGTYKLVRILKGPYLAAILSALLYTFWGFRWFRLQGHMNVITAAAMLPWMIWSLERAILSPGRRFRWVLLTGILWAFAIYSSLYFIWLGGLAIILWLITRLALGSIIMRQAATMAAALIGSCLIFAAPFLVFFWRGFKNTESLAFDIHELNAWGASLNSLVAPAVRHPFLYPLARAIYQGPYDESGVANFGLITIIVAVVSMFVVWRRRRWRPLVVLALAGTILALGVTLKWNGESIQVPWMASINRPLWQIAHTLKPAVWPAVDPDSTFTEAILLPGMLLSATIPFWDAARVSARFALVAAIGIFSAAALGVFQIRIKWVQVVLVTLLLVEILPFQLQGTDYPPATHPAFVWLAANTSPSDGIVDIESWGSDRLRLKSGGDTLLATSYHGRATASGVSSVWPAHTEYLQQWLMETADPLLTTDFVQTMRFFKVKYVALHMEASPMQKALDQVANNPELAEAGCFSDSEGSTVWSRTICLVEILPSEYPQTNLILTYGWSGQESWGVWAESERSEAKWIATSRVDYLLTIEAFPYCLDGESQEITIFANGEELAHHRWSQCEPWKAEITVPAELVTIGENWLSLEYGYAYGEDVANDTPIGETRPLAVGFSTLIVSQS